MTALHPSDLTDVPGTRDQELDTRPAVRARRGRRTSVWIGVGVVLAAALLPLIYLVMLSFTPQGSILSGNVLPDRLTLDNWPAYWDRLPMLQFAANSFIASVGGTLLALAIAAPAAYAIGRYRTGGGALPVVILSSFVAPPVVAIIPMFFLLRTLDLLNDPWGLALLYGLANTSIATFLLVGFVERIPTEISEAAQMDGAGLVATLRSIVLPLLAPGLVAAGIIVLILNYNEFILALTMSQQTESQTLPVAISLFQGDRGVQFGQMAAASITAMLPVYIAAVLLQRRLVGGLTSGSVK